MARNKKHPQPMLKGAQIVGMCYNTTTVIAVPSAIDMALSVLVAQTRLFYLGQRSIKQRAKNVKQVKGLSRHSVKQVGMFPRLGSVLYLKFSTNVL